MFRLTSTPKHPRLVADGLRFLRHNRFYEYVLIGFIQPIRPLEVIGHIAYIGVRVFVTVWIQYWNDRPVIVRRQIHDLFIFRCEQFIQQVGDRSNCDPFTSVDSRINENCWISLGKFEFSNLVSSFRR